MKRYRNNTWKNRFGWIVDAVVTVILWTYFTVGFVVIFSPVYIAAFLCVKNPETVFQYLNSLFYKGFWGIVRVLVPLHKWHIPDDILNIRSSVIICNHVSYLDPLFMIALFNKHTTIVKSRLFAIPIFGKMLILSGYIPSSGDQRFSKIMFDRIDRLDSFLASGGNLFIFPEGTRSRNNQIGELNKGAFKIAKLCKAPLVILYIQNTDKLYRPGEFLFRTCETNTITIEWLETIKPDSEGKFGPISKLSEHVKTIWETHGINLSRKEEHKRA